MHQSLSTPCLDVLQECKGSYIIDMQGRKFLDFHGNSVHQVGYRNRSVIDAINRQFESLPFCPNWSRLGRMVYDVSAALEFLLNGKGKSKEKMPLIQEEKIFLLGYSLGGMVGLYATALDKRITDVASFCGFTPLRLELPLISEHLIDTPI